MAVRLSALPTGCHLPPGRFLGLISVRGWVDPRAIVWLEGLGQLKNPMSDHVYITEDSILHFYMRHFSQPFYFIISIRNLPNWLYRFHLPHYGWKDASMLAHFESSWKLWWEDSLLIKVLHSMPFYCFVGSKVTTTHCALGTGMNFLSFHYMWTFWNLIISWRMF
jgi:hypothetical protein